MNKINLKTLINILIRLRTETINRDPLKADDYEVLISVKNDLYELDLEQGIAYGVDSTFTNGCIMIRTKRKKR